MVEPHMLEGLLSKSAAVPWTIFLLPGAMLVGLIWLSYEEWKVNNLKKKPRYPAMVPGGFFNVLFEFWAVTVADYLLTMVRQHGGTTKVVRVPMAPPGKHFFVVGDAKVTRRILENPKTQKFLPLYRMFDPILNGPSFFTTEGPRFRHARKSTNPAFGSNCVANMSRVAQELTKEWIQDNLANQKEREMDVAFEMQRLTLRVIGKVAFNYDLSQEEIDLAQSKLDSTLKEFIINAQRNPLRKWLPWLIPSVRHAYHDARQLQKLAAKILRSYDDSKSNKGTVLSCLVNDKEYASDDERIRDLLVYLSAGYDTTAATIGWTMLELAKNPTEQDFLRKELQKVPKEESGQNPALLRVIRESMRLNPSSGVGSVRENAEEIVLEDGTRMPAQSICMTCFYVIQRDGDVFERPDEFVPSRWENPTPEMQRNWITFGAGRRNCQGQALANVELYTVVSQLVTDYQWTVVKEGRRELYGSMRTAGTILKATKLEQS